ncbi:hypothetical protein A3C26_00945 [Candidatus Daviesbacteria bacterium RIFCSPHIGHO2_02_FULL_39_12]|uniref:Uncharacterized protein n=1 Tax=Candidatus Daviesbacteria bacterium RIFCSPHIGHO2_02_FULL_39_12 TaxID=1797770 RepID=A0A1F5JBC3_9BACT|nr:MAG: hypothetical protein A3C26_00945 [Candidatus Daviesbacteria bacterium RIFCSPHIGHO2_02_FULL_39_12]
MLQKDNFLYLSARTRTRVFPDRVGPQSYVPIIGPYTEAGLRVDILGRDEPDRQVGTWVLLYPSRIPLI